MKLRANFVYGYLDEDLEEDQTDRVSSPGLSDLPAVSGDDYVVAVLDPFKVSGVPEVVLIGSHSVNGATAGDLTRGQGDGSPSRFHSIGTLWVQTWVSELDGIEEAVGLLETLIVNFTGGTDLSVVAAKGDLLVGDRSGAVRRLPVGANGLALVSSASQPGAVSWAPVDTAGIADGAVTVGKMADLARGSVYLGGAGDRPVPTSLKASGKIPIGDGVTLNPVEVAGDVSLTSAGLARIRASAAGKGLTGGGGTVLSADPDDTTINFNVDGELRVKPGGIGETELQDIPWIPYYPAIYLRDPFYHAGADYGPPAASSSATVALGNGQMDCSYRVLYGEMEVRLRWRWGSSSVLTSGPTTAGTDQWSFTIPAGWAIANSGWGDTAWSLTDWKRLEWYGTAVTTLKGGYSGTSGLGNFRQFPIKYWAVTGAPFSSTVLRAYGNLVNAQAWHDGRGLAPLSGGSAQFGTNDVLLVRAKFPVEEV